MVTDRVSGIALKKEALFSKIASRRKGDEAKPELIIPRININIPVKNDMIICTSATGKMHQAELKIMKTTVEAYAKKYRMDTAFFTERFGADRPASWDKIIILYNLLKKYNLVMWMDSDAIFLDTRSDIRNELDSRHVMYMVTHYGRTPIWPNGGLIIAKQDPKTFDLLTRIWNQTDAIHHPWWEQQAIFNVLGYKNEYHNIIGYHPNQYSNLIGSLDLKWNSRPIDGDISKDPVIMHYGGLPHRTRIKGMISCFRIFKIRTRRDHYR
ncbi:putative nucleotide-diphospho-sugar transferase [Sporolactobacillus vineae]|uniref:putative nucleotide-diphospho-sugar transferase n=1 Tax=Sporolactobacillus vineae TaxID=444463 RepID=UPI000311BD99|nr:putative nucleotide-diphospho-sugar transferase [Sporolactobacillus vineae]